MPTPRHLLDDDDDIDDSEAKLLDQYETWTKTDVKIDQCDQLVLMTPKLAIYGEVLGPSDLVGSLKVGFNKKPIALPSINISEIYENGSEAIKGETTEILHVVEVRKLVNKDKAIYVIYLPILEPVDCYSFTKELFNSVKPKRVVLLTASDFDSVKGGPLFGLYTSTVDDADLQLPVLRPPAVIVGVGASIISKCEQLHISGCAIVVQGEGPFGHEIIDHECFSADIYRAMSRALKLPSSNFQMEKVLGNRMFL